MLSAPRPLVVVDFSDFFSSLYPQSTERTTARACGSRTDFSTLLSLVSLENRLICLGYFQHSLCTRSRRLQAIGQKVLLHHTPRQRTKSKEHILACLASIGGLGSEKSIAVFARLCRNMAFCCWERDGRREQKLASCVIFPRKVCGLLGSSLGHNDGLSPWPITLHLGQKSLYLTLGPKHTLCTTCQARARAKIVKTPG